MRRSPIVTLFGPRQCGKTTLARQLALKNRWGFEFKSTESPRRTKSMHIAMQDLGLAHLWVVYPGEMNFPIHEKMDCVSLESALALDLFSGD